MDSNYPLTPLLLPLGETLEKAFKIDLTKSLIDQYKQLENATIFYASEFTRYQLDSAPKLKDLNIQGLNLNRHLNILKERALELYNKYNEYKNKNGNLHFIYLPALDAELSKEFEISTIDNNIKSREKQYETLQKAKIFFYYNASDENYTILMQATYKNKIEEYNINDLDNYYFKDLNYLRNNALNLYNDYKNFNKYIEDEKKKGNLIFLEKTICEENNDASFKYVGKQVYVLIKFTNSNEIIEEYYLLDKITGYDILQQQSCAKDDKTSGVSHSHTFNLEKYDDKENIKKILPQVQNESKLTVDGFYYDKRDIENTSNVGGKTRSNKKTKQKYRKKKTTKKRKLSKSHKKKKLT